ncbi:MAG: ATPase, T2SS/T4P/T4SS family [Thermoproteus sp.]
MRQSVLLRRALSLIPRREPGYKIISSKLFWAPDVPPPAREVVEVEYFGGLKTLVALGDGVLYVHDEVEIPKERERPVYPSDQLIYRVLRDAEAVMARRGIDPIEEKDKAADIIVEKTPKRFRSFAPLFYRYFYDYGTIAAILTAATEFAITDVMIMASKPVVVVDSYKYGNNIETNIELTPEDRRVLQERISTRVGALSNFNPFVSRYDLGHDVRVTAVAGDITPTPSYAFRVMKYKWLPSTFIAVGGAEPWQLAYLCAMWNRRFVILAAGLPGSGKTSLINAVMACTHPHRRLAIIQSVPELDVPQAAFKVMERTSFGAGIPEILLDRLVKRFGLRANSEVAINELLTEDDVKAFVTVVFAGFGAAATIHARDISELLLRLTRLGVSDAEMAALKPKLIVPVMERTKRKVAEIWEPRWKCPKGHYVRPIYDRCPYDMTERPREPEVEYFKLTKEEALADPEVARWAKALEDAARNPTVHNFEGWMAFIHYMFNLS